MRTSLLLVVAAATLCACAARRGRTPAADAEVSSIPAPVARPPGPSTVSAPSPVPVARANGPMDAVSLARDTGLAIEDQGESVLLSGPSLRARFFPNNTKVSIDGQMVSMADAARREGPVLWVPADGVKIVRRAAVAARARRDVPRIPSPILPPSPSLAHGPKPVGAPLPRPASARAPVAAAGWIPPSCEQPWTWIVIHHSDDREGSCGKYDRVHRGKGWDGCGYHWVVGNGTQTGDGEVEPSERWRGQKIGAHTRVSPTDNRYNERGIGIVLVGDFEKGGAPSTAQFAATVRLTRWLMARYDIPADRVLRHQDCKATACPGKNFPWSAFQAELRTGGLATPP